MKKKLITLFVSTIFLVGSYYFLFETQKTPRQIANDSKGLLSNKKESLFDIEQVVAADDSNDEPLINTSSYKENKINQRNQNIVDSLYEKNSKALKDYLERGGDPDYVSENGMTLLMEAVNSKCEECIDFLIEFGANPNAKNERGESALTFSSISAQSKTTEKLLSLGADPNLVSNSVGFSLLMQASFSGNHQIALLLIEYGANVNSQDENAMSSLHFAAKEGFYLITETLISHGANKSLKNNQGQKAIDLAKMYNHENIISLLK